MHNIERTQNLCMIFTEIAACSLRDLSRPAGSFHDSRNLHPRRNSEPLQIITRYYCVGIQLTRNTIHMLHKSDKYTYLQYIQSTISQFVTRQNSASQMTCRRVHRQKKLTYSKATNHEADPHKIRLAFKLPRCDDGDLSSSP